MRVYGPVLLLPASAACSALTPPPATSLLSLPSLHDPHLHGNKSKMAPRKSRLHVESCSNGDSWLCRSRVRVSSKLRHTDNSWGIRVTTFTRPPFFRQTRPRSLLWYSDYMQSCNFYGDLPWICKQGDKAREPTRHSERRISPVKTLLNHIIVLGGCDCCKLPS